MLGQGRALKAVGLNFKDAGSTGANFDQVMAGLRTQVGGFAEKEGKTAAGQSAILKNQFGEVQETVGAKLVPVLMTLGTALLGVIGFAQDNTEVMKAGAVVLGVLATAAGVAKAATLAHTVATGLATAGTIAHSVAAGAAAAGHAVVTAAQWAWNAALTANPIGLVVVAIAALVAGLVLAYRNSETFRTIVDGAFATVKLGAQQMWAGIKIVADSFMAGLRDMGDAGRWLWDNALRPAFALIVGGWLAVVGAIVNGAADAFGWMPGIGPKLRAAADKFNDFKDTVNAALRATDNSMNVRATMTGDALSDLASLRQRVLGIPREITIRAITIANRVPGFAGGVQNFGGGMALVGEQGPELVYLPKGSDVNTAGETRSILARSGGTGAVGGGSGGVTINVSMTGVVGDAQSVARSLASAMREEFAAMRRNGAVLGFA